MLKARSEALQAAEEEKELVLAEAAGQAASAPGGGAGSRLREAETSKCNNLPAMKLKQSSTSNAHD